MGKQPAEGGIMPQSTRPSERLLNDRQRLRAANASVKGGVTLRERVGG
jgi:hypothetical protein